MKIHISKQVRLESVIAFVETEVDVSVEDLLAEFLHQSRTSFEVSGLLDRLTRALSLISEESISAIPPEIRKHHDRRLTAQAERFRIQRLHPQHEESEPQCGLSMKSDVDA